MKIKDITGNRFGRLVVLHRVTPRGVKNHVWFCKCDCGNSLNVSLPHLNTGHTKSCGCLGIENRISHGKTGTRTYTSWITCRKRCSESECRNYGGRGIKVCERWQKFENFIEDMGECPPGHTLDRKNNDGDYEPGNCKWSSNLEQCNNMRKNIFLEHDGKRLTASQWSRIVPVSEFTIRSRKHRGLSDYDCLFTPVKKTGPRGKIASLHI